jgi:hypothetical protein
MAATRPSLLGGVTAACRRLAGQGWRELVLKATGGELDIRTADLGRELAKPLGRIDRQVAGLADFAPGGTRGIEPANPAASLLYHLFASSDVVEDGSGKPLRAFPSLGEIEAVENYVYGVKPPSIAELRARAGGNPLAIVVFAVDYRRGADSVHGGHADLCFSRTGIARTGTIGPRYNAQQRAFEALDPAQPFAFRAIPQRFAAYVAMKTTGDRERHVPRDFRDRRDISDEKEHKGDGQRQFWVPLHKLFDGPDCIAGRNLRLDLARHLRNEKLKRFHRYLEIQGYPSNWAGDDLDRFPFVIRDEMIGSLSRKPDFGSGLLEPRPAPFATRAQFQGKALIFDVPPAFVSEAGVMYFSTAQILPGPAETDPTYSEGLAVTTDRPAPEYISIRHRARANGGTEDLNQQPDMMKTLDAGGYKAQHFIDFSGDGWIEARCPQLAQDIPLRFPAYALVSPPDFFPLVSQRDLTHWWRNDVPAALRPALWAIPPIALSERRMAANITLPAAFSIGDRTMTALVSHPTSAAGNAVAARPGAPRYSGLPDHSPGVFDPGWDTSQGIHYSDPDVPVQQFMQNYGLGTPFVEDVKLCAALGSYWPAVAPDSARTFTPHKSGPRFPYAWPTVVPLTDAETGITPVEGGTYMPWDGVRGPQLTQTDAGARVVYPDIDRVDYLNTLDKLTAALLAKIDLDETKARVLAMAAVYWSLGIRPAEAFAGTESDEEARGRATIKVLSEKAAWAVLSFRKVVGDDAELKAAEQQTSARLQGDRRYCFHVYRPGEQTRHPTDRAKVLVALQEQVIAYVSGGQVLLRRGDGSWQRDTSIPTS